MEELIANIPGDHNLRDQLYADSKALQEVVEILCLTAHEDFATADLYAAKVYANAVPDTGAAQKKEWKTMETRDVAKTQFPTKFETTANMLITGIAWLAIKDEDFLNLLSSSFTEQEYKILNDSSASKFEEDYDYSEKFLSITTESSVIDALLGFLRKFIKQEVLDVIQANKSITTNLHSSRLRAMLFSNVSAETAQPFVKLLNDFCHEASIIKKPSQPRNTKVGSSASAESPLARRSVASVSNKKSESKAGGETNQQKMRTPTK